jgi:ribosomal protein L40E
MSICYIILTCEKFLETRSKWQRECCFEFVDPSCYFYLSCKPGPNSVYGWNTADDYESCPQKYIEFFKQMDLEYDWYVFLDDDTFVFPDRMIKTLSKFDKSQSLYIGDKLSHMFPFVYMSGGASFVLSNSSYKLVKEYVRNNDICWRDSARSNPSSCRQCHIGGQIKISPRLSLVARGEPSSFTKTSIP